MLLYFPREAFSLSRFVFPVCFDFLWFSISAPAATLCLSIKAEKNDNSCVQASSGEGSGIHKACKVMKASGSLMTFAAISCCCPGLCHGQNLKNHHYHDTALFHSIHPLKAISSCCALSRRAGSIFLQQGRVEWNFVAETFPLTQLFTQPKNVY